MIRSTLEFVATPSNFLLLLVFCGLGLMLLRWPRLGLSVAGIGAAGMAVFGYSSAGEAFMAPLVTRFPPVLAHEAPAPHGIILIGEGVNESHAARNGALLELNADGDGVPIVVLLARRFPEARLIVSAGDEGSGIPVGLRQADGIARILQEFGVAPERVTVSTRGLSTYENAESAVALMGDARDQTWWVITSAHRMPRLMGAFRKQGVEPVAYPVNFRWIAPFDPLYTYDFTDGLTMTDDAVKEWLGLGLYWAQGKIDSFFPAPL